MNLNHSIGWETHPDDTGVFQVLHAAVLLVLARLSLVVLGFQRTATIVNRFSPSGNPDGGAGPTHVRASIHAVSMAAAFIPARILCLERSLVLYHKLKGDGVPVALRMGVRAFPFAAHAWVEIEGDPVHETPDFLKDFETILELN